MRLEYVAGGLFVLFGLVSAWRGLITPIAEEDSRSRFLIAVHQAAKAAFWLSLGGFFLAYGLVEEPQSIRYVALVPIALAGLRLVTAALLARG